jgi:hypothetical protein
MWVDNHVDWPLILGSWLLMLGAFFNAGGYFEIYVGPSDPDNRYPNE